MVSSLRMKLFLCFILTILAGELAPVGIHTAGDRIQPLVDLLRLSLGQIWREGMLPFLLVEAAALLLPAPGQQLSGFSVRLHPPQPTASTNTQPMPGGRGSSNRRRDLLYSPAFNRADRLDPAVAAVVSHPTAAVPQPDTATTSIYHQLCRHRFPYCHYHLRLPPLTHHHLPFHALAGTELKRCLPCFLRHRALAARCALKAAGSSPPQLRTLKPLPCLSPVGCWIWRGDALHELWWANTVPGHLPPSGGMPGSRPPKESWEAGRRRVDGRRSTVDFRRQRCSECGPHVLYKSKKVKDKASLCRVPGYVEGMHFRFGPHCRLHICLLCMQNGSNQLWISTIADEIVPQIQQELRQVVQHKFLQDEADYLVSIASQGSVLHIVSKCRDGIATTGVRVDLRSTSKMVLRFNARARDAIVLSPVKPIPYLRLKIPNPRKHNPVRQLRGAPTVLSECKNEELRCLCCGLFSLQAQRPRWRHHLWLLQMKFRPLLSRWFQTFLFISKSLRVDSPVVAVALHLCILELELQNLCTRMF